MRFLRTIEHHAFKCSLMSWNEKYIIKIETGPYEQCYKFDSYEFASEEDLVKVVQEKLLPASEKIFLQMHELSATIIE